jgi:hypothetical protein
VKVVLSDAPLLPASNDGAFSFLGDLPFLQQIKKRHLFPAEKPPGNDDASTTRLVVKFRGDETIATKN